MSWSLGAILEDDKKCHLTKRHMIMFFHSKLMSVALWFATFCLSFAKRWDSTRVPRHPVIMFVPAENNA